ncbi:11412_t:CDS:2, partial [Entrophospora sp. SA101]
MDRILIREYLYPPNEHIISNQESGWSVAISDRNEEGHALIAVSYLFSEVTTVRIWLHGTVNLK